MTTKKFFGYRHIALFVILASLTVSAVLGYVTTVFLKEVAIAKMVKVDARKSSTIVFEALYSAMERGARGAELDRVIERIKGVEKNITLSVYKSAKAAELFGESAANREAREKDPLVAAAMSGKDGIVVSDETVRYVYPVRARAECLRCHTNIKEGDVNGVIDISYPIQNLSLSLSSTLNYFLLFFVLFFIFTYAVFYFGVMRYIVGPLSSFVEDIKKVAKKDRGEYQKITIASNVYELKNLENSFNRLLMFLEHSRQKELARLYTDHLTGLPNRLKLTEDVASLRTPALAILNIDSFKEVNDFYGVKVGDFVLSEIAASIKSHLVVGAKAYRYGGDEYAILFDLESLQTNLDSYISGFIATLSKEIFMYNDYEISVSYSAGVAIGGSALVEHADMAVREAKKIGKEILFFDPSLQMSKQYENNIKWTKALKAALEGGRIVPYFQPIQNIQNEKIEKYEALVRLIDEDGKCISPYLFLSVAKKAKLYHLVTREMIEKSFRAFEFSTAEFSVNISVEDIANETTREFIFEKLKNFSKPKRVVFEITESEGIENFDEALEFIRSVKSFGAKVAIDDFGSGYSNFAYLTKLEVDYIKIDASIIKNIATDKNSYTITKTIVDFCRQMNIQTIAEFVSEKEIYDAAKSVGVDFVQGYFVGEPKREIVI